jgi:hypothetical protein
MSRVRFIILLTSSFNVNVNSSKVGLVGHLAGAVGMYFHKLLYVIDYQRP